MARKTLDVRRNKDNTVTVRFGDYVEHFDISTKGMYETYEYIKYAMISAGLSPDGETLEELLREVKQLTETPGQAEKNGMRGRAATVPDSVKAGLERAVKITGSQTKLAEAINVPQGTLSRILRGKKASEPMIERLKGALDDVDSGRLKLPKPEVKPIKAKIGEAHPAGEKPKPKPTKATPSVYEHPLLDEMFQAMDDRNWELLKSLANVASKLPELN